jgi:hypothetical protein
MKIRAKISFAGDLTLAQGAVSECSDETLAGSLIKAGFAEEAKDGTVTPAPGDKLPKAEIIERLKTLEVEYSKSATRDVLLGLLADAESEPPIEEPSGDGSTPAEEPTGDGSNPAEEPTT